MVGPISPSAMTLAIGGASARAISSMKMTCSITGSAASAEVFRPGNPGPSRIVKLALPGAQILEAPEHRLFTLYQAVAPLDPILRDIFGEPGAHFVAETQLLRRQIKIHWDPP